MVVIRIRIESKEGQSNTLTEIITKVSDEVRKQTGCAMFELFRSTEDTKAFLLYQEWQDQASFEAYKLSDPFKTMGTALPPLLASKPESVYFEGAKTLDG